MKVVIIGGVAGGAACAARLRRLDENLEIVMFEKTDNVSTATCGLPYYIGGIIQDKGNLALFTPENIAKRFNLDVRISTVVTAIDPAKKFVTAKSLKDEKVYEETFDKLVIATGMEPVIPKITGLDPEFTFKLRTIEDSANIKSFIEKNDTKKALIIGGGFIGVEVAENLAHLGLSVTIAELAPHILIQLDEDIATPVQNYMKECGVNIITGVSLKEVVKSGKTIKADFGTEIVDTDMIIMSIGGNPETSFLQNSAIKLGEKGHIIVDGHMRTSCEDIYAVGDAVLTYNFITGEKIPAPLAGPTAKQARIVADNICGIPSTYKGAQGTSVIKIFDKTVAFTGISEKNAEKLGIDCGTARINSLSSASYYPGAGSMWVKAVYDKKNARILGAQIFGEKGVDKRIDVIAMAIRMRANALDLTEVDLSYSPPYSTTKDPVNIIGYIIENQINGKIKTYNMKELDKLPRDGSVTILDVREPFENKAFAIDGAINIPLGRLRENLDKIDKSKPVYVFCRSGLRSYNACRILTGHDYNCYNLCGGAEFYRINKE